MSKISEVIKLKKNGLYYFNRVIVPFNGNVLKVIIEDDIITDFSINSKELYIKEDDGFMSFYFYKYKNLKDEVSKYEAIKIVIVEKDKDLFNLKNHRKIALYFEDEHNVRIEATEDDILFIE
ncbi:MAG TPA: hypothetical protein ENI57_12330 [Ignavibacteria bacterium]|nr:hypothetical protein [Ignavibacteria bacterium]